VRVRMMGYAAEGRRKLDRVWNLSEGKADNVASKIKYFKRLRTI